MRSRHIDTGTCCSDARGDGVQHGVACVGGGPLPSLLSPLSSLHRSSLLSPLSIAPLSSLLSPSLLSPLWSHAWEEADCHRLLLSLLSVLSHARGRPPLSPSSLDVLLSRPPLSPSSSLALLPDAAPLDLLADAAPRPCHAYCPSIRRRS
jgi:hypothetical protein